MTFTKQTRRGPRSSPITACRNSGNALMRAAIGYADRGWRVHPLAPHAKEAVIPKWPENATTDEETVCRWWQQRGSYNIGVALGPQPAGYYLFIVDVDSPQGEESLKFWEQAHGALPATLEAATGREGGRHLYYAVPLDAAPPRVRRGLGAQLDLKAHGGYVVVPPSRHPSGATYQWANDLEPAEAPGWLLELLAPPVVERPEPAIVGDIEDNDPRIRKAATTLLQRASKLEEGERNEGTFKMACALRGVARSEDQWDVFKARLLDAVPIGPSSNGSPPFTEAEASKAVQSAERSAVLGEWEPDAPLRVVSGGAPHVPPNHPNTRNPEPEAGPLRSVIHWASDIEPGEPDWLWENHLPLGNLALLVGKPKVGKSTLALDLAARVTKGRQMPDGTPGVPASAVLLIAPEEEERKLVARFMAAGGDREKFGILWDQHVADPDVEVPPTFPDRTRELERIIRQHGARLVIIDNLDRSASGGRSLNQTTDTTDVMVALQGVAKRTGAAIIAIEHISTKAKESTDPLAAIMGNTKLVGVARAVAFILRDPEDPARRLFGAIGNYTPDSETTLAFRMEKSPMAGERITWQGQSGTALAEALEAPGGAAQEALVFLRDFLADGPRERALIYREAREWDITDWALKEARRRLGVRIHRLEHEQGRPTVWELPAPSTAPNVSGGPPREQPPPETRPPETIGPSTSDDTPQERVSVGQVVHTETPPETPIGVQSYALTGDGGKAWQAQYHKQKES